MKSNQDYKNSALAALRGHWAPAVVAAIVYIVCAILVSMIYSFADPETTPDFVYMAVTMVATLLSVLAVYPIQVGYFNAHRMLLSGADDNITANTFKIAFGSWLRNAGGYFLMALYVFFWSLLLLVPGIIKSLAYSMTPYILVDNPELGVNEAIDMSQKMMKGHKFELFCLLLSFMGWIVLSMMTLCIGFFWLMPYMYTTLAAYYEDLKVEYESKATV